ncbi:MAG TPA: phasin family protein [Stellaceae bacterium]|nr:phasin family protein [Stellaceae bacterium]
MPRRPTAQREAVRDPASELSSAAFRTSDIWVESQTRMFEHFDEVARRWLDRRREALDAARQSFEEMRNTADLGELMRIQQDWVIGSMQRFAADMAEFGTAAFNFTQATASQLSRAAEGAAGDLARVGHDMMSAAGAKPNFSGVEETQRD